MILTPTLPPQPREMIAPKELVQSIKKTQVLTLSVQLKGKVLTRIKLSNGKEHIGELIFHKDRTDFVILRMVENGKIKELKIKMKEIYSMDNFVRTHKEERKSEGNIGTVETKDGQTIRGLIYTEPDDPNLIIIESTESGKKKTYRFPKNEIKMRLEE